MLNFDQLDIVLGIQDRGIKSRGDSGKTWIAPKKKEDERERERERERCITIRSSIPGVI